MKVALATIIAALCVASLAMSVAGATPTGRSGVNFLNLEAKQRLAHIRVWRNGSVVLDVTDMSIYATGEGALQYNVDTIALLPNDTLQIEFNARNSEGRGNVLKHCNSTQQYYASALVEAEDRATSTPIVHTMTVERFAFMNSDGATNYALTGTSPANVGNADTWYISLSVVNRTGVTIFVDRVGIYGLALFQETPIYGYDANAGGTGRTGLMTRYVPYNEAWFTAIDGSFTDGYNEGYGKGYEQGATDAGGGPIQSWGAFLLTAVNGFMSFEIFPNFPLWGLLSVMVAIPLMVTFLKMFAGG